MKFPFFWQYCTINCCVHSCGGHSSIHFITAVHMINFISHVILRILFFGLVCNVFKGSVFLMPIVTGLWAR